MAKRKPSDRRRGAEDETPEPDLTPIMNLTFMLILALLTTASLVPLGFISIQAPKLGGGGGGGAAQEKKEKPLNLTVIVKYDGYNIAASGATLDGGSAGRPGQTLFPKKDGKYDTDALNNKLVEIKKGFPDEEAVIIMADPDIEYGDIISTMDALREAPDNSGFDWLFPAVSFSPGVVG